MQLTEFGRGRAEKVKGRKEHLPLCREKDSRKSATFTLKANIKHHQTHRMRHFDLAGSTGSQHL